jgi:hypothetical protein
VVASPNLILSLSKNEDGLLYAREKRWGHAMFGRLEFARALFTEQFEPSRTGFLYRKSRKGAPIAVSAEERDRFIAAYATFLTYGYWGLFAALIALSLAATIFSQAVRSPSEGEFTAAVLLIFALFVAAHSWAWNAPMRALRGRGAVGPAPSREEAARQTFSRITWPRLGLGLLFPAYLLYRYSVRSDWDLGRNWFLLALAGLIIIVIAVQAFRKWRIERHS